MEESNASLSRRTRYSFGFGCIGRDAAYTLVNNFIMTYLTLAVGLSNWQLAGVGIVMVIARVWDAINDPMMGTIIDNTRTRWGKFRPWILLGTLLNAVVLPAFGRLGALGRSVHMAGTSAKVRISGELYRQEHLLPLRAIRSRRNVCGSHRPRHQRRRSLQGHGRKNRQDLIACQSISIFCLY